MSKRLLLTFGCSWMYGVGVGYTPGMKYFFFKTLAWDNEFSEQYSFRSLVSKELNLVNKNFSEGRSSNQRQFRYAKNYFGSDDFQKDLDTYDQIIVFHAITDTARNELFDKKTNDLKSFKYDNESEIAKIIITEHYDHNFELSLLNDEFKFWDMFYKKFNITNIWADTFNHHNYKHKTSNFLGDELPERDLMSQLAKLNGYGQSLDDYHLSSWKVDCKRAEFLLERGLLNPFSIHPTKEGHIQLSKIVLDYFAKHNVLK